jgi:hypothetical protein
VKSSFFWPMIENSNAFPNHRFYWSKITFRKIKCFNRSLFPVLTSWNGRKRFKPRFIRRSKIYRTLKSLNIFGKPVSNVEKNVRNAAGYQKVNDK